MMNEQDKYTTNIVDFADRAIYARIQDNNVPVATYYFECEDHTSLEAVTFDLRGGSVTSTVTIPKNQFVTSNSIQYYYNGSAVPGHPCSGSTTYRGR